MSQFDSIFINGQSLRPAPFVSTSYEYSKSGDFIIGGLLIVTLSGTLVGENINSQITTLNSLQSSADCISITIGCSGGTDFLDGAGRIRSITFSPSEQPFVQSYSIIIAVETIDGGKPAVEADQDFINTYCLSQNGEPVQFLQNYNERLTLQGEASAISSVDTKLDVSKSYIKLSGEINIASYGRSLCGIPSYNGTKNSEDILKRRAKSLLSLSACNSNILSKYNGWNKWLDTKKLTINIDGSITWSFDMYLNNGGGAPYAWIDFNTENKLMQKNKTINKTLTGKITGLSSASLDDHLSHKATVNERIGNADKAYAASLPIIANGSWPDTVVVLTGGQQNKPPAEDNYCYQRVSSNIRRSVVAGEISFSAEFADISNCATKGVGTIDVTVDEVYPAARYQEFIVPTFKKALVQVIAPSTPMKVIVTGRGNLEGCNTDNMPTLKDCVETQFNKTISQLPNYRKLILLSEKKNVASFSYTITREYVMCDSGFISRTNCSTNTPPIFINSNTKKDG